VGNPTEATYCSGRGRLTKLNHEIELYNGRRAVDRLGADSGTVAHADTTLYIYYGTRGGKPVQPYGSLGQQLHRGMDLANGTTLSTADSTLNAITGPQRGHGHNRAIDGAASLMEPAT